MNPDEKNDNKQNNHNNSTPANDPIASFVTRAKRRVNLWMIVSIVLMLFIVVFIGLAISGKVGVTMRKYSNSRMVEYVQACDDDIVKRYNDLYAGVGAADGGSIEEATSVKYDSLATIIADIEKRQHFEEDVTCQLILLDRDRRDLAGSDAIQKRMDKIKELSNRGAIVDLNISGLSSISDIERVLVYESEFVEG
jgi:hypothetical protein